MDIRTWITEQLLNDTLVGLRVGQSYMVRVRPDLTNPKLFYETCVDDAWRMIGEIEGSKDD